jgi:GntR family transcriptional regulator, transcriptional repressor for pyruvate dehydrogenase complex
MEKQSSLSKPIKNNSVLAMVLDRIKEALINKELKPGDLLPSETELVNNLGVGKTSVREAIKMLQALGVVEVRQGFGTIIKKSAGEELVNPLVFQLLTQQGTNKDILDLRVMFEPAYTVMAMRIASDEDIKNIEATIINLENRTKAGIQTVEDDLNFHREILKSTHNPYVVRIGETVLQLFEASMRESVEKIPQTALRDHKAIFKAFCEKDELELQKAVIKSFEGWRGILFKE